LPTAWVNYAASAMLIGDLEPARRAMRTAARLAEERFLVTLRAAGLVNEAQTVMMEGRFGAARDLMLEAETDAGDATNVRMHLGYMAVLLGLLTDDAQLIARFARDELVELAFRSGQAQRIEPTAVAYAELAFANGDEPHGRSLLLRAARAIRVVHQHFSLPIAIARHGLTEEVPRMRALLARWASSGENPLAEAYLSLFDAIAGEDRAVARRCAEDAAAGFRRLGFRYYEAIAEEAAGNFARA
jgi:hypothetical protein